MRYDYHAFGEPGGGGGGVMNVWGNEKTKKKDKKGGKGGCVLTSGALNGGGGNDDIERGGKKCENDGERKQKSMTEVFELFQGNSTYYHTDYMYIRGGYPPPLPERGPALAFSQKKQPHRTPG